MRHMIRARRIVCVWLAAALVVAVSIGPAAGQAGYFGVYADPAGTDCTAPDTPNGFLPVYVIHQATAGSAAAQFAVQASNPAGFVHLGESSPYPTTIGSLWIHDDGQGGAIAYAACVGAPNLVKTINLLTLGTNPDCTTLCAVPDPASLTGTIEVVDCANNKLIGQGACMFVRPNVSCDDCFDNPPPPPDPVLAVSPTSLDFGTSTTQLTLSIFNDGGGVLSWNIVESLTWLSVSQISGSGFAEVTVTVDRTGLAPGEYNAMITVESNGGNIDVPIHMFASEPEPVLSVSPTSKSLAYNENSFNLIISNTGGGTLLWSIVSTEPWLTATPDNFAGGTTVVVSVDRTGLSDGMYTGTLHVTSNGGNTDVTVFMAVQTSPLLSVSPTSLIFSTTSQVRTFDIANAGPGTLEWSLTPSEPWIQVAPVSGSGNAEITVTLDENSIGFATSGQINVTSNGGNATVQVNYLGLTPSGYLGVFADDAGTDCTAPDLVSTLLTLYVVHKETPGSGAVQAAVEASNPGGFIFLGEAGPFPTVIGSFWIHDDGQGGSTAYGSCLSAPIVAKQINLLTSGTNPSCTSLCVVPDPSSLTGTIEVVDCNNNKLVGGGACMWVNPTAACDACGAPTDVQPTTWGKIKSHFVDWDTPQWRAKQKR